MSTEDGGPAFPGSSREFWQGSYTGEEPITQGGMSLRDWFAGQALAGLLSDPGQPYRIDDICFDVWRLADAMIKTREE